MNEIGNPTFLIRDCDPNCLKQVTQFLLEICGLEVPSLGWLIDNQMSPVSTDALIKNNVRLIEIFPVPVIVLNADGTIRCVNTNFCNTLGYRVEELIDSRYIETVLNKKKYDVNGRYVSTILLSLETEQEFYRRYTSINIDGSTERSRFEVTTKLLRDDDGSVNGVCAVLFDVHDSASLIETLFKVIIELFTNKPEVVFTLNKLLAEVDVRTKHYLRKVSKLAVEMGHLIGLNEHQMSELRTSAILHHIGIIGIPSKIYLKNDYWTPEEKQILKGHPRIAYELFEGVPQFQRVAEIILHHHEYYDGTGFPVGLKGEEIPLESRIIAIAEAFVRLTTELGHQKPVSFDEALNEIKKSSGTKFDPAIVSVFSRLINGKHHDVKNSQQDMHSGEYKVKIYEMYTLMRLLNKMFEEEMGTFAKSIELTFPQVHLLTILKYHEGLLVSEIAKIGAWHISTVMSILSRLAEKELIRYQPVEKGKGSYVFLTDTGKQLLNEAPVFSCDKEKETDIFPPDKLVKNLTEMYVALEKYFGHPLVDQIKEHIFCAYRTIDLKQN